MTGAHRVRLGPALAGLVFLAACAPSRIELAHFPNPLADESEGWVHPSEVGAGMTAAQRRLGLWSDDRLLRSLLLCLPLRDGNELHRTLRKYGYLTQVELQPYGEELIEAADEIPERPTAQVALLGETPRDEIPVVLPEDEFDFAANLLAIQFAATAAGRSCLEGRGWLAGVHSDLAGTAAHLAQAEQAVGRPLPVLRGQFALKRAIVAELRGESVQATGDWRETLSELERSAEGVPFLWQAHLLRALPLLLDGDDRGATAALREAISRIEAARLQVRAPESRKNVFAGKLVAYELIIEALVRQGLDAEAERYAALAKARTLQEATVAPVAGPAAGTDRLRKLAAEVLALESERTQLEREAESQTFPDAAAQFDVALQAWYKYQVLRRELVGEWYFRAGGEDASARETAAQMELSRILGDTWIALDYFLAANRIHLWIVGRRGLLAHHVIPARYEEVQATVEELRTAITTRGDYQRLAESLYDLLVQPAAGQISGKNILVLPHQALHRLPFEVLIHGGEHLIQSHEIAYAPGLRLALPQNRPWQPARSFLGIANPDGSLENAETEVRFARGLFADGRLLLGDQATKSEILCLLPGFDVVHLAAHVGLSTRYPLLTRFHLAGGENLYLFEMTGLRPAARLVVLSACATHLGELDFGDELAALSRAFLEMGVTSVVVSLWEIDDPATAQLMDRFYAGLLEEGLGPASALAAAKRSLLRGGYDLSASGTVRPLSHPYYWAGLVLLGDWR